SYGIMAAGYASAPAADAAAMEADMPNEMATPAAPPPAPVDAITAEDIGGFPDTNVRESLQRLPSVSLSKGYLNSAQVVQRYAAGTVLQAGPGIPAWRYN